MWNFTDASDPTPDRNVVNQNPGNHMKSTQLMAARSVSIHLIPLSLNCQKKTKLTLRSVSSGAKLVVAFLIWKTLLNCAKLS